MKKIAYKLLSVAALALCIASCNKAEQPLEQNGQRQSVMISLVSPDAYTKAIGDGTKAKDVYYTAFVNGQVVESLSNKAVLDADGKATLTLDLVVNVTYDFVFWAQCEPAAGEPALYDLSNFYVNSEVKANYQTPANDDDRDAFCASKTIAVTKDMADVTIYLTRPFSQINFCASDYDDVKYLGLHTDMESEVYVYDAADILKVLDGSVSTSVQEAHFGLSAIPSGEDEYITVQGNQYGYVGMNYIFASEGGETVKVKANFVNGTATWETGEIASVPVKRNYKTNITGDIFTENANLTIIIESDFNTPDQVFPL